MSEAGDLYHFAVISPPLVLASLVKVKDAEDPSSPDESDSGSLVIVGASGKRCLFRLRFTDDVIPNLISASVLPLA